MRFSTLSVSVLVAIAHGPSVIDAFPNGAGGCMAGQAAIGPPHLNKPTVINGTLVDGGYSVAIDGEPLPLREPLDIGETYTISMEGPEFHGVLIMSDASPDNLMVNPVDDTLKQADACDALGYDGITQVDAAYKSSAEGELLCITAGTYTIGITVVGDNDDEESIFYYSGFPVECGGAGAAATQLPVASVVPINETTPEPPGAEDEMTTAPTIAPSELPEMTMAPTTAPSEMTGGGRPGMPGGGMITETISPTDNATATDIPTEFNETDVPMMDLDNETEAPTEVGAPTLAPGGVPTGGAGTTPPPPPPSSATSITGTLLLSLGATVAVVVAWSI